MCDLIKLIIPETIILDNKTQRITVSSVGFLCIKNDTKSEFLRKICSNICSHNI